MYKDRKYVLTTPEQGWEKLARNLKELDLELLRAVSVDDALSQLDRLSDQFAALAIPSLVMMGIYERPQKVELLVDDAVTKGVPRVGVVDVLASSYYGWRYKSNPETIVRVAKGDDSDSFFVAYARFLAGQTEDL